MPSAARTAIAAFATYNVAAMSTWLQPAYVGDYTARLDLPTDTAGLVASIELVAMAAALYLLPRFLGGRSVRDIAFLGLAVTITATIFTFFPSGLTGLIAVRGIVGVGYAMLLLGPTVALAGLDKPQFYFGWMYTISLICSAGILSLLPIISSSWPAGAGLRSYVVYALALSPLIAAMPKRIRLAQHCSPTAGAPSKMRFLPLSAAISLISIVYAAVWTFFMLLGEQAGMSPTAAAHAGSIALLAAMAGSLAAPFLGGLIGEARLLPISAIVLGCGVTCMLMGGDPILFTLGGCLTLACFFLIFPTVMGIASHMDPSGQGTTLITSHVMFLIAAGPYVGGLLIKSGFSAIVTFSLISCIVSAMIFWHSTRHSRGTALSV